MSVEGSFIVVGGGPAAAAAAKALVAAGRRVIVLDAGLSLEPEREAARGRMAATAPEHWQEADVALTRFSAGGEGQPGYKQLFGSDLAFRDDGVLELSAAAGVGARPSYALGGLSNVWGSGVMAYTDSDLAGWPITAAELADGYRAVLGYVPLAAEEDELARRYPLFRTPDGPLIRTPAGEQILARMRRHAGALAAAGYSFGAPRLAVRVGHPAPSHGCVYCGHCLDGCPYGHIYNAAQTMEEMQHAGAIDYRPGLHVDRVIEADGEVIIEATPLAGGQGVTLRAERAFLGAGVFSTTIILQRSALAPARSEILDSQALYVPFAWVGPAGATGREPGHTLAQGAVVLEDPAVARNPIHMSLYTYSEDMTARAREAHPRLAALAGPALQGITRRMAVGICFFHSEDSDRVASICEAGSRSVRLEPVLNAGRPATIARFKRSLLRSLGRPSVSVSPKPGRSRIGAEEP